MTLPVKEPPYLHNLIFDPTILNGIYEKIIEDKLPEETLERFLKISPIAWSHISLIGKYNFKKSDGQVNFEEFLSALEKHMKRF